MIRFFRALVWLRWRLLVNALRGTRRRDSIERVSRFFQAAAPILLFVFLIPAALVLGLLGLAGGWILGSADVPNAPVLITLRILLAFSAIVTVVAPLLRAVQGSPPNLSRFLLLPIPRGSLYLCEALAGYADPWLAVQVPALLWLPVGFAAAGRPGAAVLALLGGIGLLVALSGLSLVSSFLSLLLFRDRRRGEILSVLLILGISLSSVLPGILTSADSGKDGARSAAGRTRAVPDGEGGQPLDLGGPGWSGKPLSAWALVYPPELYFRVVALGADRRTLVGLLPLAVLLLAAAGVHALAWAMYRRLLETPEIGSSPRRESRSWMRWGRLPGLNSAASAVALAQVRLAGRTVQGRILFWMVPLMTLAVGLAVRVHQGAVLPARFPISPGILLAFFGLIFAVLTMEGTLLNQFASDRAGLALQFLAPLSDREIVRGKAAGGAILAGSRALIAFAIAAATNPGGPILLWMTVPAAGAGVFLLLAPAGSILSALLPKTADLNRIGHAGKPHPIASLLGLPIALGAAAPAVGLTLLAVVYLKSSALAFLLVCGWVAVAALLSAPLVRLAARILGRRRENLVLVAQGR